MRLTTNVSTNLQTIRDMVKRKHDAGVVHTCQSVELLDERRTFRFVVGRRNKVSRTVDHHQMNASMLMVRQVHHVPNCLHTLLSVLSHHIQRIVERWIIFQLRPTLGRFRILI